MIERATGRVWAIWFGGGLAANLAWEMLQMPLYGDFQGSWWRCFRASLGDLFLIAGLYALMACAAEDWAWFERLSRWRLLLLGVRGFLVAVLVEQQALLAGLWRYKDEMPRVPFLGVAWIPVMQMILIPLGLAAASHFWGLRDGTRQGGPRV